MKRCTRQIGLLALGLFLMCPLPGISSPVDGILVQAQLDVPAGNPGTFKFTEEFVGGQRACVIVRGDHLPYVDLSIEVYDEADHLVARDGGKGDYVAAIWYPPADGKYTIVIKNPQDDYNRCYVSIR